MQIAGDIAALVLLNMDHAPQQPVVLLVEPRETRRQRVDPVGDGDELGRAAAGNAGGALAPLQPGEPLGQRRNGRQRARHRDEDQSEGRQRDKPAANRQRDDLLPDFGDFIGGIGRDQHRALRASGHLYPRDAGARRRQRGKPAWRAAGARGRGRRLGALDENPQMAERAPLRQQPVQLRRGVGRAPRLRESRLDEIAREARRGLRLGADARARVQRQQPDAE